MHIVPPLISVIIPIYNAEFHITSCVESVLNQTHKNIEIILVNDGSTDNSLMICQKLSLEHRNIKLYTIKNSGANYARSYGVKHSTGDYITFVDADDTLIKNGLSLLLYYMGNDTDIVEGRCSSSTCTMPVRYTSLVDYRIKLLYGKDCIIAPWGKLFRKKLFTEHIFDIPREIVVGEDLLMNLRISFNSNKSICQISEKIYNYNVIDSSTFHSYTPTIDYLVLFHSELKKSITENHALYMPDIIKRDIFLYIWNFSFHIHATKNITNHGQLLYNEAKNYNVKLPFPIKQMLLAQKPIWRYFLSIMYRIIHHIKSYELHFTPQYK